MKQLLVVCVFACFVVFATNGQNVVCRLKADVVFIVDSSRSIWKPHYDLELEFLANLTKELNVGPEGTHVGALSFSKGARKEFYLNEVYDAEELQARILAIPFMSGMTTQTDEAFKLARTEMFKVANGARKGLPRMVFIVTDGNSVDRAGTKKEAQRLRNKGVQVFAVGIGDEVAYDQLAEMATKDTPTYVHNVNSFSSLSTLLPELIPAACRAATTTVKPKWTTTAHPVKKTTAEIPEKVKELCTSKKADVVFVLDKSSSIQTPHFRTQLNFVSDVVGIFSVSRDHTHVGVVTFDTNTTIEFGLQQYFTKSEIRRAILDIQYTAGATNTYKALQTVATHVLTPEQGSRKGVATVVIVVTDGKSSNETLTHYWAEKLKASGAYVFAIGVGPQIDHHELSNIGSQPHSNFVFEVREGYGALATIKDILAARTCDVLPAGDIYARCQRNAVATDVMFITDFTHAGARDVSHTTELVKSLAGGIMASGGKVRVGLVSSACPDVTDVRLNRSTTAEEFADAVTSESAGGLAEVLSRARIQLTKERSGARKGVQRLAVVFVHGPVSDVKEATREVMRAKSSANRPGVKFIFVGMGERAVRGQLQDLAAERRPANARIIMTREKAVKGKISMQPVLTKLCEELAP